MPDAQVDADLIITCSLTRAGFCGNAQCDRGIPLIHAGDRITFTHQGQIIGLELMEAVLASRTDHHGALAATQPQSPPTRAMLRQLPASWVRVGETGEPAAGAETGKTGCMASLYAPEEGLKGSIQPPQCFLQRMTAQFDQLWPELLDAGKGILLVVVGDGDTGLAVRLNPLLQGGIVQLGMQTHPVIQPLALAGIGVQLEGHFASLHSHTLQPVTNNPNRPLDPPPGLRPSRGNARAFVQLDGSRH